MSIPEQAEGALVATWSAIFQDALDALITAAQAESQSREAKLREALEGLPCYNSAHCGLERYNAEPWLCPRCRLRKAFTGEGQVAEVKA